MLYRKLAIVMMVAAINGNNVLDLGAFGCGAFKNKPEDVAPIIKHLLEKEFSGVFTHVIFPIGENDPNRKPFLDAFPIHTMQ